MNKSSPELIESWEENKVVQDQLSLIIIMFSVSLALGALVINIFEKFKSRLYSKKRNRKI